MNRRIAIFFAVVLAWAGGAVEARAQQAVFVVRHGEMISEKDERLTEAGRARADRLAKMLRDSKIAAVYSTDTERTIGTARPLADAIGQKIRTYDAIPALVDRIRRENPHDAVLVVGHSNTVGPILTALGCAEAVQIASDEYDNLFLVLPREGGKPTLIRLRY